MMKVFAYRKCSTCMKALKWLEIHNVEFEERAIKEENPTYEELKEWYTMSGHPLKKFFNTIGMIYKQINLKAKLDRRRPVKTPGNRRNARKTPISNRR